MGRGEDPCDWGMAETLAFGADRWSRPRGYRVATGFALALLCAPERGLPAEALFALTDTEAGRVIFAPNLPGWKDVPLKNEDVVIVPAAGILPF